MTVSPTPPADVIGVLRAHVSVYSNCLREHQVQQIAIKIPVATAAHFNFPYTHLHAVMCQGKKGKLRVSHRVCPWSSASHAPLPACHNYGAVWVIIIDIFKSHCPLCPQTQQNRRRTRAE